MSSASSAIPSQSTSSASSAFASQGTCASSASSALPSQGGIEVSPGKAVDIRGKCFSQLANLNKLFDDSILAEGELKE